MSNQADEVNWLNSSLRPCPQCDTMLYQVDHSPFYDAVFLSCNVCANLVEVSMYDSVVLTTVAADAEQRRIAIEARLSPCNCGGRYSYTAPRRCYTCRAIIIDKGALSGIDLWPSIYGINIDDREPTAQENIEADAFDHQYIRREGIWQ